MPKGSPSVMNILFITATRLGDAVLSTAALDALLKRYPDAAVTIACGRLAAPLFEGVPNLERIIVLNKRWGHFHWFLLWLACVKRRWTCVADLRGSGIAYFLWTRARIIWRKNATLEHRVLSLARLMNVTPPTAPVLWTRPQDEGAADTFLKGLPRPILAIAPMAYWPGKTWPLERFATLIQALTVPGAPFEGGSVLLCGAPSERAALKSLSDVLAADIATARVPLQVIGGDLPLLTLACVLKHCRLFVGNDSGLMHIAAATGIPTLGLFGPSQDVVYGPWGLNGSVLRTPESYVEIIRQPGFSWTAKTTYMGNLATTTVIEKALKICALEGIG